MTDETRGCLWTLAVALALWGLVLLYWWSTGELLPGVPL